LESKLAVKTEQQLWLTSVVPTVREPRNLEFLLTRCVEDKALECTIPRFDEEIYYFNLKFYTNY
jgi:hypothetical protein